METRFAVPAATTNKVPSHKCILILASPRTVAEAAEQLNSSTYSVVGYHDKVDLICQALYYWPLIGAIVIDADLAKVEETEVQVQEIVDVLMFLGQELKGERKIITLSSRTINVPTGAALAYKPISWPGLREILTNKPIR